MSTEHFTKWFDLASCPVSENGRIVPTGLNKDNFIVIEADIENAQNQRSCRIHKYNINSNKWVTTLVPTEIIGDAIFCSDFPAFDTKQNTLYFLGEQYLIQMELNNKQITKHLLSSQTNHDKSSQCIILHNELFVIGGESSDSISKWNGKTKQLTQINTIYNNTILDVFGSAHKTNSVLLFGGYDNMNEKYVDYILEYNASTNKCN
eukprot:469584_1